MSKADIFKTLANKETWSIEEVLELLCGPSNPSAIIRGETHEPIGELLETAANQGRFGMLTTGIDKFYWDLELPPDYPYPDQPLDIITDFTAHYLRFIDWIEDEDILDKVQLDTDRKEEILGLIKTLNEKRPEVKPAAHVIDYQRLIEEDFWTLTDLRIVLFGETYSSRYVPDLYHKYNSNLESLMQKIDRVIQDAALAKRYLEAHNIQNRSPLIDSAREDELEDTVEDFGYFGVYDTAENGYRSERYYYAPDLFSVLTLKGFPIPQGLAASLDQNQIKPALELLKKLKENILYLVAHGENPPNVQVDQLNAKPKVGARGEEEQNFFEKEGNFWIVSIEGEETSGLKDLKGMSYLSHLFKNKGKKFHVVELERLVYGTPSTAQFQVKSAITTKKIGNKYKQVDLASEDTKNSVNTSIGDMRKIESHINPKDLRTLLDHKTSLELELDEAINTSDIEEKERIEDELMRLKKALNIVSFAGKGKSNKPETDKFRQRIQRTIKSAIDNINNNNPKLGQLLSDHINTGEFCFYHP
jgi:hypothetical protein